MAKPHDNQPFETLKEMDTVIAPGISVHVFGKTVGIYCERIESGRGFAELPLSDFQALIRHFSTTDAMVTLRTPEQNSE